jgi:hypothetical protein
MTITSIERVRLKAAAFLFALLVPCAAQAEFRSIELAVRGMD